MRFPTPIPLRMFPRTTRIFSSCFLRTPSRTIRLSLTLPVTTFSCMDQGPSGSPPKPNVTVVPGEDRVTLYWDNASENSIDPLTGFNDFEGYKIYRSEDPAFSDIYTISDANGTPFLGKPLLQNG